MMTHDIICMTNMNVSHCAGHYVAGESERRMCAQLILQTHVICGEESDVPSKTNWVT